MITTKEKRAIPGKEDALNKKYKQSNQGNNNTAAKNFKAESASCFKNTLCSFCRRVLPDGSLCFNFTAACPNCLEKIEKFNSARRLATGTRSAQLKRHLIYHRLLTHLENNQIRPKGKKQCLPFILHDLVKNALIERYEFSDGDLTTIEESVIRDVEKMTDYESVRDVPSAVYQKYKDEDGPDFIFGSRTVSIPNSVENALICKQLEKEFTRAELLTVGGFIKVSIPNETGISHNVIRLDIDEKHCRSGFMVPIVGSTLITALEVYRFPGDGKPFVLRTRVGGLER